MTFIVIFHILVVCSFSIRILLRDDLSPPARLAWFIVLNVLPYVGAVLYFLFGEIDLGNKARQLHDRVFAELRGRAEGFMGQPENTAQLIKRIYQPAFHYAASINGFHPVAGNRAELMTGADETIERMIADMDAATDHIHVLYYIWLTDHTGTAVAEALIRAAKRGIKCRAIADGLGSRALIGTELWHRMKLAGVELAVALSISRPMKTILTSRLDLRNHRKITVIDSTITYCGSRNCADPEFLPKSKYGPWIDIMLRLEGPIVAQNQLLFASDWMQATGQTCTCIPLEATAIDGGFPALVMGAGPTERSRVTPQLFVSLFASAESSLTLTTPYFVPDSTTLEALCAASYRGVKVTLIFPERNDSWIVAAVSHSYYHQLLDAGCLIYEHREGLLHAKTLTVDGKVSLIGSSNLDLRSFDLNYENNILLQDEALTAEIYARQQQYIVESRRVELPEVLKWPYYRRIWNNVIATIGPVL